MPRSIHLPILLLPFVLASCATSNTVPTSKNIADARLDLEQCPVHSEQLIENLQMIDWERGSYHPLYYTLRESLFPCAYVPPTSGDLALVTYCPQCRAAKAIYESGDQCESLYSSFSIDEAGIDQPRREIDAFIEKQKRQLDEEYAPGRQQGVATKPSQARDAPRLFNPYTF